jgi:protein TonB
MASSKGIIQRVGSVLHPVAVVLGACLLTLAFFLVLPLMQAISKPPDNDSISVDVGGVVEPPPPPPPEEEPEEEEPEEEDEPVLEEEAEPLTLEQLTLALNPTIGDGALAGDFSTKLNTTATQEDDLDSVFSMADLDQKPRIVYQPGPRWTPLLRKKAPGTVYILFIVNKKGAVENPMVQKATDPVFAKPALAAVKQWKFEPGKRNGKPVRFRMRVPITFPRGN